MKTGLIPLMMWSLAIAAAPAANAATAAYPAMSRTFTNNSSQQNRYLQRVTTEGTATPEVFNCTTQAELPFTNFTASANTYVEAGAIVDKTANPIRLANGTRSFTITYYGWQNPIGSANKEMDWTQEACFIDWNGNGSFTDPGEISEKGNTAVPNPEIYTGFTRTVSVPEGQPAGTYRMRVVFFEPQNNSEAWPSTLFTTLNGRIRNGVAYDFDITVDAAHDMTLGDISATHSVGAVNPGRTDVEVARIAVAADGSANPLTAEGMRVRLTGDAAVSALKVAYKSSADGKATILASKSDPGRRPANLKFSQPLAHGMNYFVILADVADDCVLGTSLKVLADQITIDGTTHTVEAAEADGIRIADIIDYSLGNALWFDSPTSSTLGAAWNINDFSSTSTNPDQVWERQSFPIGNGSFGGNILGSVARERVVLNEKTLWKGGPGTGAASYWDMNNNVSASTLATIRQQLASGSTSSANSTVASNYRGKINYDRTKFGTYTTMGEVYVQTGIDENSVTDYKRIMNIDRSIVVVQFNSGSTSYQRRYFCSYPDSVMVWRYTAEGDAAQNLTFTFNCPQIVSAVTSPSAGNLLYEGRLDNNGMKWAMRVAARSNDPAGTVTADPASRTITVSGSRDVEFILAADTDYAMNFDPDITDNNAFVGVNPKDNVNACVGRALTKSWDELYDAHYADYSELYGRVELTINPDAATSALPTPRRLAAYRAGTLDHGLEQQYFQYGRYLLISSSRAGNMPANLQGMWHNNVDGPWRVDYHNNINLQMNYWPATCTNLLECMTPFVDYVRGLVKPGERTAKAYYGARGWTAEVSTNIFGFTAPLNSTDMSWNYNPTAGPWLATQIWEYYDYTRDRDWLREIGYPIIRSSADFVSDLLYLHNGTYTSAPSYSPEHGSCDLGATYANAVTREVLSEALAAAEILGDDTPEVDEWREKLDKMYPYQVGRYGQLQEWYNDIDTYNDTHRHTNHLFGLHPGSSINALTDTRLADACKETLRQRGDAATGWSMGWKLNHWARLLDGDHAYILFQNLLKEGTADNMWDMHPPFQIDGNFGGTAGVAELFLQSHNGFLHLLPALPSKWTDGHIKGLRTRGNFTVDVYYAGGRLDHALVTSNAGEPCEVYYDGHRTSFATVPGESYTVRLNDAGDGLAVEKMDDPSTSHGGISADAPALTIVPTSADGNFTATLRSATRGKVTFDVVSVSGVTVKSITAEKNDDTLAVAMKLNAPEGVYFLHVHGSDADMTRKFIVR